jgi:hypothetical protein
MLLSKTKTSTHGSLASLHLRSLLVASRGAQGGTTMNLHHAATQITSSHERYHEADTHLHGRWLLLARIVWFTLVVLILSIYIARLPDYFTELQTVCRLAPCSYSQLSSDTVVALQHFGLSVGSYATFMVALATLVALAFFGTGGFIFWRKSDDWMALLFALICVIGGTMPVLWTVATSHSVWRLPVSFVTELLLLLFFLAFILFPDGRFVPRWTRWLFVVFGIESVIITYFTNLFTTPPEGIEVLLALLFFSSYAALVIAQMYRYRYVSTLIQRQQTKWVVYGFTVNIVVTILVFVLLFLPILIFPRSLIPLLFLLVYICTMLLYPFTIGFAILRYRLWDIDVLINRTLVYGSLTVTLALVYFGLVIGLQWLVHLVTGTISEQPLVIVASTLAIAALFQPLRRRIQRVIDRRFYRRKYDAARIVAAFSATLRNEIDLSQLREQLITVVEETMQPSHVSLWLRPPDHEGKQRIPWRATLPVSSEER